MTEHEIATMAAYLLDKYLDRHWQICFLDSIPTRGGGEFAGHTSWDQRIIRLSRRSLRKLPPEGVAHVIQHEVAHALTPEDWTHGEVFQAKFAEVCRG